uniref:Uncharacterized protein n=1 Tax=Arion vulgaris TaxID=1028688 RepID=A0A0B7BUW2_9EUPU
MDETVATRNTNYASNNESILHLQRRTSGMKNLGMFSVVKWFSSLYLSLKKTNSHL